MENTTLLDVLIVGGGPTGLTLASDLTRRGLKVRIIDKNQDRTHKSKAMGVQAGTLEALESSFGPALPRKLVEAGRKASHGFYHYMNKEALQIDLSHIPSVFNYILILEQSETERFLEELMNSYSVAVERNTELITFTQNENSVNAQIKTAGGATENIRCRYLVGCDGAHSTVRHTLELPFKGGQYQGDFILADMDIQWPYDYTSVRVFFSDRGVVACFPFKAPQKFRFIAMNVLGLGGGDSISEEEFHSLVERLSFMKFKITKYHWLTRFKVSHRMVDHFQKDRVFLAGDSAHIHSPIGGQGMNTGIQDALNLSHKISGVLLQKKPISFLEKYEKQRKPVAAAVLRGTNMASRMALLKNPKLRELVMYWIGPRILNLPFIQKTAMNAVSEVKIARREIADRL